MYRVVKNLQNIRMLVNVRNDLLPLTPEFVRLELRFLVGKPSPDGRETENNLEVRQRDNSGKNPHTNPGHSFCRQMRTQCWMVTNGEVTKTTCRLEVDNMETGDDGGVLESSTPWSLTVSPDRRGRVRLASPR
jgi:hypothetical protein